MNRLLICIILLGTSVSASAETLYRWIEADGSITFSPTKPPAGVEYTAVEASGPAAAAGAQIQPAAAEKSILATSEHSGDDLVLPRSNDTKVMARPTPAVAARQGLQYAPETQSANLASPAVKADAVEPAITVAQAPSQDAVASSNKRRQCQDLSKRVMSLERRLRSPLAPDDMDNTVIAMARYQRSFDQHCVE